MCSLNTRIPQPPSSFRIESHLATSYHTNGYSAISYGATINFISQSVLELGGANMSSKMAASFF